MDAPDPGWASTVRAVAELERQVTGGGLEGVVLRYGTLYGPRTAYARTGATAGSVLAGRLPLPGGGAGITSFLHVEDAVGAAVAAVESDATGVFHVTDDDPAPAAQWLPHLARVARPRPPRARSPRPSHPGCSAGSWPTSSPPRTARPTTGPVRRWAGSRPEPSWRDGLGQE